LLAAALTALVLAACAEAPGGDATRGARLFTSLPCAGCHGASAQGQFGPSLAGTTLDFEAVQRQVRTPRDKMPAFDGRTVSDGDLRHIHAWLVSLPTPAPSTIASLPPAEATQQARDHFYPLFSAADLLTRAEALDEAAFRLRATVRAVTPGDRFTEVRLHVADASGAVDVAAIYDTGLHRGDFPAAVGEEVTVYGIGADPVVVTENGSGRRLPRLQIIEARREQGSQR
jgi:hypothetical protein